MRVNQLATLISLAGEGQANQISRTIGRSSTLLSALLSIESILSWKENHVFKNFRQKGQVPSKKCTIWKNKKKI